MAIFVPQNSHDAHNKVIFGNSFFKPRLGTGPFSSSRTTGRHRTEHRPEERISAILHRSDGRCPVGFQHIQQFRAGRFPRRICGRCFRGIPLQRHPLRGSGPRMGTRRHGSTLLLLRQLLGRRRLEHILRLRPRNERMAQGRCPHGSVHPEIRCAHECRPSRILRRHEGQRMAP